MTYRDDDYYQQLLDAEGKPSRASHKGHVVRDKGAFWLFGQHLGRTIQLGPFQFEQEANEIGFKKFGGSFEVEFLPTINMQRAASMFKAKRVRELSDIEKAMSNVRHSIPGET